MPVDPVFYPISLDEIELKVARKNRNRNNGNGGLKNKQLQLFDSVQVATNVREIFNEYGEKIIRVDGEIPINLNVSDGDRFLFISYDQSALTHGVHKYPAKFFPELPRWIIKRYSREGELVLDPFAGSGTTNLEALLNRRHSVGIDIDPFSRFLASVKVTPLNPDQLESARKVLLDLIIAFEPEKVAEKDVPVFPYRDNWFNREVLLELAYLRKSIESLNYSQKVKNFYHICLSSIADRFLTQITIVPGP